IRTIWPSRATLIQEVGRVKGLSVVTELLPVLDPAQDFRARLSRDEAADILRHANDDLPGHFRDYLGGVKARFARGRLGAHLDKTKHLEPLKPAARGFHLLQR